jgi:hypothetical protein
MSASVSGAKRIAYRDNLDISVEPIVLVTLETQPVLAV